MKKPFILGTIFARGGSKGIPGKNLKPLAGKPLIAYAIEAGLGIPLIDRLIVSTDDDKIAEVSRQYGAEVPFMRPAELAADNSPELLSWKHALTTMKKDFACRADILVSLPATSPLRSREDIMRCIKLLLDSKADIVVTVKEAERNPYFNMLTMDKDSNARVVIAGKKKIACRQEAPVVYDMTTVAYAARVPYILSAASIMEGRVKAVVVPRERALDIDTLFDFELAEFLASRKKERS
ncbi:MAG: acylneuraminate cytidylyltransferase family protein [Candidatus Omnitrophota bacterium]